MDSKGRSSPVKEIEAHARKVCAEPMSYSKPQEKTPSTWILWGVLALGFILLTLWSWQKWETAWIERSETLLPLEWQGTEAATLAWKYPIYRSNDTYQWVYLADALARGESAVLQYRHDEGPLAGRANAWHSGLAQLLRAGGAVNASLHDWPVERGIHDLAHWLGALLQLLTIALASFLIYRLFGLWPTLSFALIYFFNAAIGWDFAFSRLDHEALFQLSFVLQIIGIIGLLRAQDSKKIGWALLAGVGTAGSWWISAAVQSWIAVLATLGCIFAFSRAMQDSAAAESESPGAQAKACLIWGVVAAVGILLLCALDRRGPTAISIAALHPIFALAQLGACTVCAAAALSNDPRRVILFGLGLTAGLSPLIWVGIYEAEAHVWLNPMMRRLHSNIVEFQSPFTHGVWKQALALQAFALTGCALMAMPWKKPLARFLAVLILGLLAVSLLQARWLGLLAAMATISFCISVEKRRFMPYLAISLATVLAAVWVWKWEKLEAKTSPSFVADMFLHVGARDINLNIERYNNGETARVAIPYGFAATSALFTAVHPLGTLYWENRAGIATSAEFFASTDDTQAYKIAAAEQLTYLAVQAQELGKPFARMVLWTAYKSQDPLSIEQSLAWRLAQGLDIPVWCEPMPFKGTFDPATFGIRLYRVRKLQL